MKVKFIIFALCAVLLISVGVGATSKSKQKADKYKNAAELSKELDGKENKATVGKVGNKEIKDVELEKVKLSYSLVDKEITDQEAFDMIVRNEVLYQTSLSMGYGASDKEVEEYHINFYEALENSPETKEFIEIISSEMGLTVEEYMESIRETTVRDLSISNLKQAIMSEKKYDDINDFDSEWEKYVEKLIKKAKIEKKY